MIVKLTSCATAMEAEMLKGALAEMGIECILQGKNISQIYGGIGAMSVNVLVDESDYERAKEYIDSLPPRQMEDTKETEAQQEKGNNSILITLIAICVPFCTYIGLRYYRGRICLEDAIQDIFICLTIAVVYWTYKINKK